MSAASKESNSTDVVFAGVSVENWFKFDRQVMRYVRKKFGDAGEQLWMETAPVIDNSTVEAIATAVYEEKIRSDGIKEATSYWEWDHFWSVEYQHRHRL